ncbi:MAG: NADPH-dependent 2,4-dienoyl-CoA reductase/sulfur reductase-like enzyme/pSer/pThr, partial [Myxococcota bacterium]
AGREIRRRLPTASIQIICDDPNPAYYRAALTNYLIGELRAEQLHAVTPGFYHRNRIERTLGRVSGLDTAGRQVHLQDGRSYAWDRLILATGARPRMLSFPGSTLPGVMGLRTLVEAQQILDESKGGRIQHAVIVGGGPLALEWAQGLREHQIPVTQLLRRRHVMRGSLDKRGSDLVLHRMERGGVRVIQDEVAEALPGPDGRVAQVRLKSGQILPCDLLGLAVGIVPNIGFLDDCEVETSRGGVVVNERMESSVPGIFAAGDVAVTEGKVLGLWAPARAQALVAAGNAAGGDECYRIGIHYSATRLFDLDFAYAADEDVESDDERIRSGAGGVIAYQRIWMAGDRLVRIQLLGERPQRVRLKGRLLRRLIAEKTNISTIRDLLLDPHFDLQGWAQRKLGDRRTAPKRQGGSAHTAMLRRVQPTKPPLRTAVPRPPPAVLPMASRQQQGVLSTEGGATHRFTRSCRIGRAPDNDLVLLDDFVSGHQCELSLEHGALTLISHSSTNPTQADGQPVDGSRAVSGGTLLEMGSTRLRLTLEDVAVSQETLGTVFLKRPVAPPAPPAGSADGIDIMVDGTTRRLSARSNLLGRDATSTIRIQEDPINLYHAEIIQDRGTWYLRDLGSRDGTWVNGNRVTVPHILKPGDEILIGTRRLIVPGGTPKPRKTALFLCAAPGAIVGDEDAFQVKGLVRIGRDPERAETILTDDSISGLHAECTPAGKTSIILRDLGSTNGTFVNGEQLGAEPVVLEVGQSCRLGETDFTVELREVP